MQLSATEIYIAEEPGARPSAIVDVLNAFKPGAVYVPAQLDESMLQHLRAICSDGFEGAAADPDGAEDGADASVYNWPAPSEQLGANNGAADDVDGQQVLQLATSKHFKLVQVRPTGAGTLLASSARLPRHVLKPLDRTMPVWSGMCQCQAVGARAYTCTCRSRVIRQAGVKVRAHSQ